MEGGVKVNFRKIQNLMAFNTFYMNQNRASIFSVMSFTVCIGDANKHYSGVIKFVLPQKSVNGFWRYLLPGSCREITVAN
jgi:hypothetical protein